MLLEPMSLPILPMGEPMYRQNSVLAPAVAASIQASMNLILFLSVSMTLPLIEMTTLPMMMDAGIESIVSMMVSGSK